MRFIFGFVFLLIVIGFIFPACTAKKEASIDVFIMSQCPYGVDAAKMFTEFNKEMGGQVKINFEYIVSEENGKFESLHGENEVKGNIQQLCVKNKYPNKFFDFLDCQNKDPQNIPQNGDQCAKEVSIDVEAFKKCVDGDEGTQFLRASMEKSKAKSVSGSPTIYIGSEQYMGPRSKDSLKLHLCKNALKGQSLCKSVPDCYNEMDCGAESSDGKIALCEGGKCVFKEAKPVDLVVLSDKRCNNRICMQLDQIIEKSLKQACKGIKVTRYDYNDAEGKKIFADEGLETLPAILFKDNVQDCERYSNFEKYLRPTKAYKMLALPSDFDPICEGEIDTKTNTPKVDCKNPRCKDKLACRPEKANTLDLFVMSMCPYGVNALNSMVEVLKNFNYGIKFNIHFISSPTNENETNPKNLKFQSLHGQPETDENIRELCAQKYYPTKFMFMNYITCRNKSLEDSYETCMNSEKMPKIKQCFESGEGHKLLLESAKIGNALKMNASPSWLVNNKYQKSGLTPEQIKTFFCENNKLPNCSKTLSNESTVPAGKCGQ